LLGFFGLVLPGCLALLLDVLWVVDFVVSLPPVLVGFLNPGGDDDGDVVVVVVVGVVAVVVVVAVAGVVDVEVGVVLGVVGAWQLAVTFVAPGGTFGICAAGVLGEELTVIVTFWGRTPGCAAGVYVTVQGSADATGMAVMDVTARTKPTVMTKSFSLWLLNTLDYLLPPRACAARIAQGGGGGTLTLG
jgi:hypothetical protein